LFSENAVQPVAVPSASRPSNRLRMPPAVPMSSADSTLFDPLSGMSWTRDSLTSLAPFATSQPPEAESRQESTQDSLARYQTFAQSIDELRRSPPAHLQQLPSASPNPWSSSSGGTGLRLPPVIAPSTTTGLSTGLDTARTESTGLSGISAWYNEGGGNNSRPPWAMPRHEPLPMLDEPRGSSRSPYSRNNDARQPSAPTVQEPIHGPSSSQPSEPGGNWLREWERERDRLSRAAREEYLRRREPGSSANATASAGPSDAELRRRPTSVHRPLSQLNDTQAQGRMWDEYTARHEPRPWPTMTRSSLAATGFTDDDVSNGWSSNGNTTELWGNLRRPPRRPELLPPRSRDADAPIQFSEPTANRVSDLPFTESPPSLLQELIDLTRGDQYDSFSSDVFQSFQRANSQRTQPEPNPADFRHASEALRRSLIDTSHHASRERDSSARTGQPRSPPSRRFMGLGDTSAQPQQSSTPSQVERSRLSSSRDRWETQFARSQSQLERVRQLLHSRK
jgi:hypothetical protein